MTSIAATLPDDLQLHEGEELDLHAVAKNGLLMVTRVLHRVAPKNTAPAFVRQTFSQKWRGKFPVVNAPNDPIISHLNARHVK